MKREKKQIKYCEICGSDLEIDKSYTIWRCLKCISAIRSCKGNELREFYVKLSLRATYLTTTDPSVKFKTIHEVMYLVWLGKTKQIKKPGVCEQMLGCRTQTFRFTQKQKETIGYTSVISDRVVIYSDIRNGIISHILYKSENLNVKVPDELIVRYHQRDYTIQKGLNIKTLSCPPSIPQLMTKALTKPNLKKFALNCAFWAKVYADEYDEADKDELAEDTFDFAISDGFFNHIDDITENVILLVPIELEREERKRQSLLLLKLYKSQKRSEVK